MVRYPAIRYPAGFPVPSLQDILPELTGGSLLRSVQGTRGASGALEPRFPPLLRFSPDQSLFPRMICYKILAFPTQTLLYKPEVSFLEVSELFYIAVFITHCLSLSLYPVGVFRGHWNLFSGFINI